MKKFFLLLAAIFLSLNILASKRFLIETEKSIDNVSLINSKIGKIINIPPLLDSKNFFTFEVENIEDIFLKFSNNINIKLYSFSDKKGTNWHPVSKDEKLSVKSLFSSSSFTNMEFEIFITSDFTSPPISSEGGTTRGERLFYTKEDINFSKPENLYIAWKSTDKQLGIKLQEFPGAIEIFYSTSFSDTVYKYESIPEEVKNKLKYNVTYLLTVKTSNGYYGNKEDKLIFKFEPLSFTNKAKELVFVNEQKIEISWEANDNETLVKVYDEDKNLVFQKLTTSKSWTFEPTDLSLKYQKPYKIELSQDGKSISKNFYVLFSYSDYNRLKQ